MSPRSSFRMEEHGVTEERSGYSVSSLRDDKESELTNKTQCRLDELDKRIELDCCQVVSPISKKGKHQYK